MVAGGVQEAPIFRADPLDRFSLGRGTQNLTYGVDRSLSLAIGGEEPTDPALHANWISHPPTNSPPSCAPAARPGEPRRYMGAAGRSSEPTNANRLLSPFRSTRAGAESECSPGAGSLTVAD
jgi:hypothetical protein